MKLRNHTNEVVGKLKCIEDLGMISKWHYLRVQCLECGKIWKLRSDVFLKNTHICTNYVGESNGVLTVEKDLGFGDNGRHMVLVRCSRCGSTSIIRADRIIDKYYTPKSCTHCYKDYFKELADKKYAATRHFRKRKNSILGNAKGRNIKMALTDDHIKSLLESDCYYCGTSKADGIDRVDSDKDYTVDNVVPCCKVCNRMKNKFPLDLFLSQVKKIYSKFYNEGSTTIPKGSTPQANGGGNGEHPEKDDDIV